MTSSSRPKPLVSVLTPSIPERAAMLEECKSSVEAQTYRSFEHLCLVDVERNGCSGTVNELAKRAQGDWLFILADDDLLLPDCLWKHVSLIADADIVYGPPDVEGEDPAQFRGSPPNIPATALIRRSLWERVGGYDLRLPATEDRDFYERASRRDIFARFRRVDDITWIYRFHGDNKSRK